MTIYNYNCKTGEYLGESQARPDPLEPHKYLIPACATTIKPPKKKSSKKDKTPVFNEELKTWTEVEDHRGKIVYNKKTGEDHFITELGKIPEEYTLFPKPSQHHIWSEEKGEWEIDPSIKETLKKQELINNLTQNLFTSVVIDDKLIEITPLFLTMATNFLTTEEDPEINFMWYCEDNSLIYISSPELEKILKDLDKKKNTLLKSNQK